MFCLPPPSPVFPCCLSLPPVLLFSAPSPHSPRAHDFFSFFCNQHFRVSWLKPTNNKKCTDTGVTRYDTTFTATILHACDLIAEHYFTVSVLRLENRNFLQLMTTTAVSRPTTITGVKGEDVHALLPYNPPSTPQARAQTTPTRQVGEGGGETGLVGWLAYLQSQGKHYTHEMPCPESE